MDTLEPRRLFAGTITIDTTGPEVLFTGDGLSNQLEIRANIGIGGDPTTGYRIGSKFVPTLIVLDGVPKPDGFETPNNTDESPFIQKPWRISLGGGDDALILDGLVGIDVLTANMDEGNDYFFLKGTINALSLDMGSGDDTAGIFAFGLSGLGNASLFLGAGRDKISFTDGGFIPTSRMPITGRLQIQDTQGPLKLLMERVDVSKETSIITGNSIDRVTLTKCSFGRSVILATHGGKDVLTGDSNHFRSGLTLAPGAGNDTVSGLVDDATD